jgi:uncharacterized membrane protein
VPLLHTEKTSTGLEANLAAALSYLLGFVSGIVFLVLEKENRFVRFHALQSVLAFGGITLVWMLLNAVPFLGFVFGVLVIIPASAILWLVMMFKAYQGQDFRLPIVGPIAAERT